MLCLIRLTLSALVRPYGRNSHAVQLVDTLSSVALSAISLAFVFVADEPVTTGGGRSLSCNQRGTMAAVLAVTGEAVFGLGLTYEWAKEVWGQRRKGGNRGSYF